MKINFRPVAILENYIANIFRLENKGRKLLGVGFALSGTMAGVSILVLAGLLASGSSPHLWWKAMLPWTPIAIWASWRFLLRYLHPKAFVCERCGRLKCVKARSTQSTIERTQVCLECERRSGAMHRQLRGIHMELDKLLGDVGIVTGTTRNNPTAKK